MRTAHDIVLGAVLRCLRAKAGMDQSKLAEATGCSAATLSRIECGHTSPTVVQLRKIGVKLGVDASEIIRKQDLATKALAESWNIEVVDQSQHGEWILGAKEIAKLIGDNL